MTVFVYLVAIVAANLSAAYFGPSSTIWNAFLFIGLDLTLRDKLHESWQGNGLKWKMALLITTGGLLAYLINTNAGMIAVASSVAFAGAGIADWAIYTLLKNQPRLVKMNGSNVVSAAVDSLLFPTIAFGGFMPLITLGQWVAKVGGGLVWSLIIEKWRSRQTVTG